MDHTHNHSKTVGKVIIVARRRFLSATNCPVAKSRGEWRRSSATLRRRSARASQATLGGAGKSSRVKQASQALWKAEEEGGASSLVLASSSAGDVMYAGTGCILLLFEVAMRAAVMRRCRRFDISALVRS